LNPGAFGAQAPLAKGKMGADIQGIQQDLQAAKLDGWLF